MAICIDSFGKGEGKGFMVRMKEKETCNTSSQLRAGKKSTLVIIYITPAARYRAGQNTSQRHIQAGCGTE